MHFGCMYVYLLLLVCVCLLLLVPLSLFDALLRHSPCVDLHKCTAEVSHCTTTIVQRLREEGTALSDVAPLGELPYFLRVVLHNPQLGEEVGKVVLAILAPPLICV
jgi:hypothetical protein